MSRTAEPTRTPRDPSRCLALSALVLLAGVPASLAGQSPLEDTPIVWYDDDRRDVPEKPVVRDPDIIPDAIFETVLYPIARAFHPGRLVRQVGTVFGGDHVPPAANVNRLDEVPGSTWFTNRIGLLAISPKEAARGPGEGKGPVKDGPWTVVGAKTAGVTPGFTVEDRNGDTYLLKFDPPDHPGLQSAAGVIANRILYAAGYNVPDDAVTYFQRDRLEMGDSVMIPDGNGGERIMTDDDVDALLENVHRRSDGSFRALSSEILGGEPLGPFSWAGIREDDPNDRVDHENRRELRGFEVFASWLCHFDIKQQNTLDMWVEEDGRHFVKHHFIDLASALGAGQGLSPMNCFEHKLDAGAIVKRLAGLGFKEDEWRKLERSEELVAIGYFESRQYEPREFKPFYGNETFANVTDRDGYWAAKIISAFTDELLEAIVAEGRYEDPEAARYMARVLAERRDKLARAWFDRVPPLDFFRVEGDELRFQDLGAERGIYPEPARYRIRMAPVDADREGPGRGQPVETGERRVRLTDVEAPVDRYPFLAVEIGVSRGRDWSDPVTVYLARRSGRVVGVQR